MGQNTTPRTAQAWVGEETNEQILGGPLGDLDPKHPLSGPTYRPWDLLLALRPSVLGPPRGCGEPGGGQGSGVRREAVTPAGTHGLAVPEACSQHCLGNLGPWAPFRPFDSLLAAMYEAFQTVSAVRVAPSKYQNV